jgi:hypothetical protein
LNRVLHSGSYWPTPGDRPPSEGPCFCHCRCAVVAAAAPGPPKPAGRGFQVRRPGGPRVSRCVGVSRWVTVCGCVGHGVWVCVHARAAGAVRGWLRKVYKLARSGQVRSGQDRQVRRHLESCPPQWQLLAHTAPFRGPLLLPLPVRRRDCGRARATQTSQPRLPGQAAGSRCCQLELDTTCRHFDSWTLSVEYGSKYLKC